MKPMAKEVFKPGDAVEVWINDIIGCLTAVVIRDRSTDEDACRGLRLPGEAVWEVKYIGGSCIGSYADVPVRNLRTIVSEYFPLDGSAKPS